MFCRPFCLVNKRTIQLCDSSSWGRVEGPWRAQCQLKKAFYIPRRRQRSCWEELQRNKDAIKVAVLGTKDPGHHFSRHRDFLPSWAPKFLIGCDLPMDIWNLDLISVIFSMLFSKKRRALLLAMWLRPSVWKWRCHWDGIFRRGRFRGKAICPHVFPGNFCLSIHWF